MSQTISAKTAPHSPSLPARPGRPSRKTLELVGNICSLIQAEGLSDSAAGLLAGISTSSVSRWKLEDEDFAILLGQARARFDLTCLREIRKARKRDGTPDWRAHAWLLQNSSADGYRKPARQRKKSEAPVSGAGEEERVTVTLAELEQIIQARLEAALETRARNEADGLAQNIPEIPETPRGTAAEDSWEDSGDSARDDCSTQGVPHPLRAEEENGCAEAPRARSEITADAPKIPETRPEVPVYPDRTGARQTRRQRRAEQRRLHQETKSARRLAA